MNKCMLKLLERFKFSSAFGSVFCDFQEVWFVFMEFTLLGTAVKVKTTSWAMFSYRLLHVDELMLADQPDLTYNSSV